MRQIEVDLSNSEIKSPVNGVDRATQCRTRRDRAARLQAPVLFLIADDLSRMEIAAISTRPISAASSLASA